MTGYFFKITSDYSNIPDFGNFDINGFGSSSNPAGSIEDLIPDNVKCETKLNRRPRAGARIVGGTIVNRNTWKWYVRLRKCSDTISSGRSTNPGPNNGSLGERFKLKFNCLTV